MKSRITIEVDFENGNQPVIQIVQRFSDDVRDKLISEFLHSLGGQSSWCKLDHIAGQPDHNLIRITPLRPEQLQEHSRLMAQMNPGNPRIPVQEETVGITNGT